MKLRHDWRALVCHAWSLRLNAASIVLSGLEVAIGVFASDPPIPRGVFAAIALVVTVGAAYARLVQQRKLAGGDA